MVRIYTFSFYSLNMFAYTCTHVPLYVIHIHTLWIFYHNNNFVCIYVGVLEKMRFDWSRVSCMLSIFHRFFTTDKKNLDSSMSTQCGHTCTHLMASLYIYTCPCVINWISFDDEGVTFLNWLHTSQINDMIWLRIYFTCVSLITAHSPRILVKKYFKIIL